MVHPMGNGEPHGSKIARGIGSHVYYISIGGWEIPMGFYPKDDIFEPPHFCVNNKKMGGCGLC